MCKSHMVFGISNFRQFPVSRVIDISMGSLILTQEVKWHAVLVAIHAHRGDPEIPSCGQVFLLTLNVARSFVFRVKHELETSGCHFASMAKRKKHSHTNFHTKFPSSVIIRGVVSSEGHVLPQHFLQEDLRVNAAGYIGVLETVVKPWIDQVAQGRPYVLQQDSDPAHKAEATQEWLAQNHSRPRAPGHVATQLA